MTYFLNSIGYSAHMIFSLLILVTTMHVVLSKEGGLPLSITFDPAADRVRLDAPLTVRCELTTVKHESDMSVSVSDGISMLLHCPISPWGSFCFQNCKSACVGEKPGKCPFEKTLGNVSCQTIVTQEGNVKYEYTIPRLSKDWLARRDSGDPGFYCRAAGLKTPEVWLTMSKEPPSQPVVVAAKPQTTVPSKLKEPQFSNVTLYLPRTPATPVKKADLAINEKHLALKSDLEARTAAIVREIFVVGAIIVVFISVMLNVFCCTRYALIRQYSKTKGPVHMQHLFCMAEEIRNARLVRQSRGNRVSSVANTEHWDQPKSDISRLPHSIHDGSYVSGSRILIGNPVLSLDHYRSNSMFHGSDLIVSSNCGPMVIGGTTTAFSDTNSNTTAGVDVHTRCLPDGRAANLPSESAFSLVGSSGVNAANDGSDRRSKTSSMLMLPGQQLVQVWSAHPGQKQLISPVPTGYYLHQPSNIDLATSQTMGSDGLGSCLGSLGQPDPSLLENYQPSSSGISTLQRTGSSNKVHHTSSAEPDTRSPQSNEPMQLQRQRHQQQQQQQEQLQQGLWHQQPPPPPPPQQQQQKQQQEYHMQSPSSKSAIAMIKGDESSDRRASSISRSFCQDRLNKPREKPSISVTGTKTVGVNKRRSNRFDVPSSKNTYSRKCALPEPLSQSLEREPTFRRPRNPYIRLHRRDSRCTSSSQKPIGENRRAVCTPLSSMSLNDCETRCRRQNSFTAEDWVHSLRGPIKIQPNYVKRLQICSPSQSDLATSRKNLSGTRSSVKRNTQSDRSPSRNSLRRPRPVHNKHRAHLARVITSSSSTASGITHNVKKLYGNDRLKHVVNSATSSMYESTKRPSSARSVSLPRSICTAHPTTPLSTEQFRLGRNQKACSRTSSLPSTPIHRPLRRAGNSVCDSPSECVTIYAHRIESISQSKIPLIQAGRYSSRERQDRPKYSDNYRVENKNRIVCCSEYQRDDHSVSSTTGFSSWRNHADRTTTDDAGSSEIRAVDKRLETALQGTLDRILFDSMRQPEAGRGEQPGTDRLNDDEKIMTESSSTGSLNNEPSRMAKGEHVRSHSNKSIILEKSELTNSQSRRSSSVRKAQMIDQPLHSRVSFSSFWCCTPWQREHRNTSQ